AAASASRRRRSTRSRAGEKPPRPRPGRIDTSVSDAVLRITPLVTGPQQQPWHRVRVRDQLATLETRHQMSRWPAVIAGLALLASGCAASSGGLGQIAPSGEVPQSATT